MKKQMLSVLLVLALCLGLLPRLALAAEGDVTYRYCDENGANWQTGTKGSGDYTLVTADDTAWSNGWYVASGNVTIGTEETPQRVTVTGDVHLILMDGCNLTINGGIQVADDDSDITNDSPNTLTIYGQQIGTGTLTSQNVESLNAGIGGNSKQGGGTIIINGGTVTTTGAFRGAGIGGGAGDDFNAGGTGGTITINGGKVNATGGWELGAGIGGGGCGGTGGAITINDGIVTAAGGARAAGIGGGGDRGAGGTITINGGVVTATAPASMGDPAGIGGAGFGAAGTIVINGGKITANGCGRGIGGGAGASSGTITISGGTVAANGIRCAASTSIQNGFVICGSGTIDTADQSNWHGVIFQGNSGQVYGNSISLTTGAEIPGGKTLTIPENTTLTINNGVTLTNNGSIINNGTITGNGGYSGTGTVNKASQGTPGTGEGYTISYTAETITAKDGYEVSSSNSMVQGITDSIPGSTFYVRKAENDFYNASGWTSFTVANRPATPTAPLEVTKTANSITIINTNSYPGCEFSKAGTSWNATGTFSGLTAGTAYTIQVRVKATASSFKSTSMTQAVTTVAEDGSTTVKPGESAETGGATITNDGEKVIITGGDGTTTTITPPTAGGNVNVGVGSGVAVPGGSKVQTGDNGPEITVGDKGGTVDSNGSITVPDGGTIQVGDSTITLPEGGTVKPDPDNSTISLPGGATVEKGGETISVPDGGGTYHPDGTVTQDVCTVTFDSQGGSEVAPATVTYGKKVTKPTDPTRDGHTFGGWYQESGCTTAWDFDTYTVTSDVTLYAAWTKNHVHSYGPEWKSDATGHWQECECGEKSDQATHAPGDWIIDQEATSTSAGSKHKECTVCGYVTQTETIPATGQSSGGSSSPSRYPPTVEQPKEGGTAGVSPSSPKRGDTVIITPKPDEGYEVGKIIVTNCNGQAVEVKANPDGTYSFIQPSGRVKIEVIYQPIKTPWSNPFTDVAEGAWYYDAVEYAAEHKLFNGTSNTTFSPNATMTRAMLVTVLARLDGQEAEGGETWYAQGMAWTVAQGISDGTAPDSPITREQLAAMLYRYARADKPSGDLPSFVDGNGVSTWALDAVTWAVENGIIHGKGSGVLDPKGEATRAEVAAMLMRCCENKK